MFLKIVRGMFVGLALLILLVALLVIGENWRGRQEWERCKRDLEMQGEHLGLAAFIPPPVPDEQNFAMTPLLKPLLDYTLDPKTWKMTYKEPNPPVKKISVYIDDSEYVQPSQKVSWQTGNYRDLQVWQNYYRVALPDMVHPKSSAEDMLAVLGRFDGMFAELREEAKTRPFSRFPVKYLDGYFAAMPHYRVVQEMVRVLAWRAGAELNLNRPAEAIADIQFGFRLADSIRHEPIMISGLVRISLISLLMQPIWEGISSHLWSDDQLAKLTAWFRQMDFLSDLVQTIRAERARNIRMLAQLSEHQDLMRKFLLREQLGDHPIMSRAFLKGWFYQNMAIESRSLQEMILSVDVKKQLVDVPRLNRNDIYVKQLEKSPYTLFAKITLPVFNSVAQQFLEIQIYMSEAIIACTIERYNLVHYAPPATLDDLHMDNLPHDIINGEPLHYRGTGSDNYILYSVGWNGTDDGGKTIKENNGTVDFMQGDLVWSLKPL